LKEGGQEIDKLTLNLMKLGELSQEHKKKVKKYPYNAIVNNEIDKNYMKPQDYFIFE
jgi:hypothetical protein